MKVLKIIGIIILVLVILIILLGLIAPKKYQAERSVLINAPKEIVFRHVVKFKNWNAWSPWAEKDSVMTVTVEGKDGEKGAVYKWIGDPKITGEGEITNTGVIENEELTYHLHFIKPWESFSDGYTRVAEVEGATKTSWGISGKERFPWNIMLLFMSMDKMIGPDFERGLALLKEISEKEAEIIFNYEVTEVNFVEKKYAVVQKVVSFNEIAGFFENSYPVISQAMGKAGARLLGAPVGLYFSWDENLETTDLAVGMPTSKVVNTDVVKTIEVPAGKAYSVDYYGPYEGVEPAHWAIDLFFKKNNLQYKAPVIEEYITDPSTEPDSSRWLTRIYYFVK